MNFVRIQARIADAEPFERRQSTRKDVEIGARVRELGNEGVEARVLNISSEGFMAETDGTFDVGTRIWLMLPNRERANALIKWTAGNKIGAEFSHPMQVNASDSGLK
jgi:hypothetical protein